MFSSVTSLARSIKWDCINADSIANPVLFTSKRLPKKLNLRKDTVYLVSRTQIADLPPAEPVQIACYDYTAGTEIPKNVACIFPQVAISALECEQIIKSAIATEEGFDNCSKRLYEAFMSRKGIQHIVNEAHEVFGNPIFIMDYGYKSIAFAGNIPNDEMWEALSTKGYYDIQHIRWFKSKPDYDDAILYGNQPKITIESMSPNPYIPFRIVVNGIVVGFASLIEYDQKFRPRDTELMELFCKLIGLELQTNSAEVYAFKELHQYFIAELLSGAIDAAQIPDRLSQTKMKLGSYLCIIAVRFDLSDKILENEKSSIDLLSSLLPNTYSVIYNQSLVIIASANTPQILKKSKIELLKKRLKSIGLKAGVSSVFTNISNLKDYYRQAIETTDIAGKLGIDEPLSDYYQYQSYFMLRSIREGTDLLSFCDPKIMEIRTYDKKYNTSYLDTLRCYSKNNFNAQATSRNLSLHRNTIDYRLNKIRELFDIDINNMNLMFKLSMSFQIIDYIELVEEKVIPVQ